MLGTGRLNPLSANEPLPEQKSDFDLMALSKPKPVFPSLPSLPSVKKIRSGPSAPSARSVIRHSWKAVSGGRKARNVTFSVPFCSAVMTIFTPPEKLYRGYIFDCDGTLAHSMPIHYKAWRQTAEENGVQMSEELFYSLGGVPTTKIVEILNEKFGAKMDPEQIARRKEAVYVENMSGMQPLVEVTEFARKVATFAKVSVASGGYLPVVLTTLEAIGFKDFFPVVVTTEQVSRGKPFPDMFLEAAKRMGVQPSECLVLEDSPAGIEAAKAAGMDFNLIGKP
jgi:HAD superfamily hydrolase (TIGR01509 family)